jgi:hypothetical protein
MTHICTLFYINLFKKGQKIFVVVISEFDDYQYSTNIPSENQFAGMYSIIFLKSNDCSCASSNAL